MTTTVSKLCGDPECREGKNGARNSDDEVATEPLESLLGIVPKVIGDYCALANSRAPTNAKEIAAFHSACRAILSHLDMLLRLAKNPAPSSGELAGGDHDRPIDDLIAEARKVLEQHPGPSQ